MSDNEDGSGPLVSIVGIGSDGSETIELAHALARRMRCACTSIVTSEEAGALGPLGRDAKLC